jgi:hypothetical protein
LLEKGRIKPMTVIGHLDLVSLLRSGIAVDLSKGKQLAIGILRPKSRSLQPKKTGKTIRRWFPLSAEKKCCFPIRIRFYLFSLVKKDTRAVVTDQVADF